MEWGGFPGDTGTCRIAWIGWNAMNDWNVWNAFGRSSSMHGWISRRSPCLLSVEFLFWIEGHFALWSVVVVLEELFVFCM